MSTCAFVPVTVANGSVTEWASASSVRGVRQRTLLAILPLNANGGDVGVRSRPADVGLGRDLVEGLELILVELELDRFEVLLEVRDRTGPRDRQDHRRVVQQPRQRDLTG